MGPEILAYPFLFIAIFFESFILVTFLSAPAREARVRTRSKETPSVAIIVPCLNEASTVAATVHSLLALEYPKEKLSIVLVDNASTDDTPRVMEQFRTHPQIQILREELRGKHIAVNAGIAISESEIIGCLDADSFVAPEALQEMIPCFAEPKVAAVTAAMSVHEPRNILQYMQSAEYIFGITVRHVLGSINGLYVTPGPFSLYRREVVAALGGFRDGHQTEDMELALRLQREGYKIENAPRARVYTKPPATLRKLIKQRTRWITGFLRNIFGEYWVLVGNARYGALGMIVLPLALLSIVSGILLFGIALFMFASRLLTHYQMTAGTPLTYAYLPHSFAFDWFYLPTNALVFLSLLTLCTSITMIVIGKSVSKTPGNLFYGLAAYLLLYGIVAPLWLIRATTEVAIGKKGGWR